MSGLRAFREAFMSGDTMNEADFSNFDSRQTRYDIYWAFYENTAYRDLHKWATAYRASYGLYKYIRNIYNPAYRIGEFWKSHLMGGALDPLAGDGKTAPSALPIRTENEALRPAIAQLWTWSNWQISKDILCLHGAVMGDVVIKVVDDPIREKCYLKVIHPGTMRDVTLDDFGNVKAYTIEEERPDPLRPGQTATYREIAGRDGDMVTYQTLRNGDLYAWSGGVAEWAEPYGFIPMVLIQHNNVGMSWGWSELHPCRSKFHEVDDLASKLSDQVRKMVDAPWLFSGVDKPKKATTTTGTDATTTRPEPGREELPALYGPVGANATPLVAPLDIGSTAAYIKTICEELERDYPELNADVHNIQGDISGRAIRISRQPVEAKVEQRRANYDNALVRAQQMAVAIGGYRGYKNFTGFNLDSYAAGALDHSIGARPVFPVDPLDNIEIEQAFWTAAGAANTAGAPLEIYLRRQGWTDEQIAELQASPEYQAKLANQKAAMAMNERFNQSGQG